MDKEICLWYSENRKATQNVLTSSTINLLMGTQAKDEAESIPYYEKSAAHVLATQCHRAKLHPKKDA